MAFEGGAWLAMTSVIPQDHIGGYQKVYGNQTPLVFKLRKVSLEDTLISVCSAYDKQSRAMPNFRLLKCIVLLWVYTFLMTRIHLLYRLFSLGQQELM